MNSSPGASCQQCLFWGSGGRGDFLPTNRKFVKFKLYILDIFTKPACMHKVQVGVGYFGLLVSYLLPNSN